MIERIERTNGVGVKVDVLLCVCDREECGWAWLVAVSKGEPKRCSHCKRGNWNVFRTSNDSLAKTSNNHRAPMGQIEAAVVVMEEVIPAPSRAEIRDSLRGLIQHMEAKDGSVPVEIQEAPERRLCRYTEYDGQTGETYRCGSDEGHRGKHTRGEQVG